MKLDVQQGNIDVANRSLSATDIDDLKKDSKVKVNVGPGGEIRYIIVQLRHHAVRRQAPRTPTRPRPSPSARPSPTSLTARPSRTRSTRAPTCRCTPTFPDGFLGANESFKDAYGDARQAQPGQGQEGPRRRRSDHPGDHEPAVQPGPLRQVLRRRIRHDQGPAGEVAACSRSTCSPPSGSPTRKASRADEYPLFQLGWFPDSQRRRQLPDALLPARALPEEPLQQPTVNDLISKQLTTVDKSARESHDQGCPERPSPRTSPRCRCSRARRLPFPARTSRASTTPWTPPSSSVWELFPSKLHPCGPDQPARRGALEAPRLCWSLRASSSSRRRPMAADAQL